MNFKLDFQVQTSVKGHKILKKLSGIDDSEDGDKSKERNSKAPFKTMSHAILFSFILGLFYGDRKPLKYRSGNWHFSSIQKAADSHQRYDLGSLLKNFGKPEDFESPEAAHTSVMEYINWGLYELDSQSFGDDDYRFGEYIKQILE